MRPTKNSLASGTFLIAQLPMFLSRCASQSVMPFCWLVEEQLTLAQSSTPKQSNNCYVGSGFKCPLLILLKKFLVILVGL